MGEGFLEGGRQPIEGLEFAVLFLLLIIRGRAAGRVLDKLGGQRQGQAGGSQEFGLQHWMEVGNGARGMFLGQASVTMVMREAEKTGAIDGHDEVALVTEIVEGFHADEPLGVLVKQVGEGGAADVAQEMIEGLGHREGLLLGARQQVEVVEDGAFHVAQVVVGRTAAPQAQPEEQETPPAEKAAVVLDHRHETRVGQFVQPTGHLGEEVEDGFEKGLGQGYDLPRRRRLAVTWVWTRARDS